jgi:hypothetical protein
MGLLGQPKPEATNPLTDLGMTPQITHEFLNLDADGTALRGLARTMYRGLSGRIHPDIAGDEKAGRFKTFNEAWQRIDGASKEDLARWARNPEAATAHRERQATKEQQAIVDRAGQLVLANMRLGSDPLHFSQLRWSQGMLVRGTKSTILLREDDEGIHALPGTPFDVDHNKPPHDPNSQAFDFRAFLREYGNFGIEEDTKIAAFLDETGRATILDTADLGFMMDVTLPVKAYRRKRKRVTKGDEISPDNVAGWSNAWSRTHDALLITTQVASDDNPTPATRITTFPRKVGTGKQGAVRQWDLPQLTAGSASTDELFKTARFGRKASGAAIEGRTQADVFKYFGLAGVAVRDLVETDTGYTPLLSPRNNLMLYDTASGSPVATDAKIIGVLGNGPQA